MQKPNRNNPNPAAISRVRGYPMRANALFVLVGLVGFSSVGCASDPHRFSTSGFSLEQEQAIRSAADEWCSSSNGAACPVIGDGDSHIIGLGEFAAQPVYESTLGLHIRRAEGASDIYLLTSLSADELRLVALHELGHHFGCDDTDDGSIMSAELADIVEQGLSPTVLSCATR